MNREILMVVDAVSNEKGVAKEIIFEAIEAALASATRKRHNEHMDVRVSIDRETGAYDTFRCWTIVDDAEIDEDAVYEPPARSPDDHHGHGHEPEQHDDGPRALVSDREVLLTQARQSNANAKAGDIIEESMPSEAFGRIAAQTAKQVIVQKVREAERAQIVDAYKDRVGEIVSGIVKRNDRGSVIVDLGANTEALIEREALIPREIMRPGDRVRGYLKDVRAEPRGPQLFISRTAPELMVALFTVEVPEIGEGLIEIVGCARDPGSRAKIGVRSKVPRIDPVGACVGMRGSRVQAVSNELGGERVDIIPWDENPAQFVINAMAPAEVVSIVVDEDSRSMDVAVNEEQLSQAIGRGGQNVRLASQLSGWELNVMTESEADKKSELESERIVKLFQDQLTVDENIATILQQEGFTGIEEVAFVPEAEMLEIDEFDADIVNELQSRAQDVLLSREIASEEGLSDEQPSEDLLALDGMDEALAHDLARRGVATRDDLAELAVAELQELTEVDAERAGALIMAARAFWFEEAQDDESGGDDGDDAPGSEARDSDQDGAAPAAGST